MKNAIFYNPKCGNCRETLDLIRQKHADIPVVEYLKEPPDAKTLEEVCKLLGMRPYDLVRQKEPVFTEKKLASVDPDDHPRWIRLMVENPVLIQRPIVVYEGQAAVCRPPENVLKIL